MLTNFQALGARMSIKVHYLFSHLDRFPENIGDVGEEQGERFHQTSDQWKRGTKVDGTHMMADYCWSLIYDCEQQVTNANLIKENSNRKIKLTWTCRMKNDIIRCVSLVFVWIAVPNLIVVILFTQISMQLIAHIHVLSFSVKV